MRKKMVRIERMNITPRMAAELLASNSQNRPISRGHVTKLAEAMKRGEWDFNGTTIKVASSGRLLDGQHRLSACVEAETAFDTLVVYDLEDESFATIDQGLKARKISDVLSIEAGASMKNVAAALFALYQLREFKAFIGATAQASAGFSAAIARDMLRSHPGIVASVAASNNARLWRNAYCACLHYVFGIVDSDLANDFIDVMRDGSRNIKRPFNLFREGIIHANSRGSARPDREYAAARAIKAFNAETSGKTVSILTWRRNEEFPLIAGFDYESI